VRVGSEADPDATPNAEPAGPQWLTDAEMAAWLPLVQVVMPLRTDELAAGPAGR
jgi:hypothetical protein